MVSMYSMNDALYRRDTYCFGLSDVCVIVVVAASFGRRRRMAVVFAVKWFISILYSSQSTETHTHFLPIFGRHDTNSVMNGLGLHERKKGRGNTAGEESSLNSTLCNLQEWYVICLI